MSCPHKLILTGMLYKEPNNHEKSSFAYDNSHFHLFYHLRVRKTVIFAKVAVIKKAIFGLCVFKFHCEKRVTFAKFVSDKKGDFLLILHVKKRVIY